jgi:hypothetical protein
VELKPSLEDLVQHSGVKGMKWDEAKKKHNQELAKLNAQVAKTRSALSESYNILAKGDFTGKGPWEEDSKTVDNLFNIREGFLKNKESAIKINNVLKNYADKTLSSIFGNSDGKPHGTITNVKYGTNEKKKSPEEIAKEKRDKLKEQWKSAKDSNWLDKLKY